MRDGPCDFSDSLSSEFFFSPKPIQPKSYKVNSKIKDKGAGVAESPGIRRMPEEELLLLKMMSAL